MSEPKPILKLPDFAPVGGLRLAAEVGIDEPHQAPGRGGALPSIGSVGDSYDNALAESTIGLYKAECVHREGPWRSVEELELATLSWIDWYNSCRLHSSIDYATPLEYEHQHHDRQNETREPTLAGQPVPTEPGAVQTAAVGVYTQATRGPRRW